MQYMLLIYEDESAYAEPEAFEAILKAHNAYAGELAQAGVIRGGAGLKGPETATTVRRTAGAHTLHDGPFAETREQLGGFYIIEAPDLDAALAWARKLPLAADGSVEVRPVMEQAQAEQPEAQALAS
jgi:hypothetical protein